METKVIEIMSKVMDVPVNEINLSTSPENLEKWDSFQHMNLILALEEELNVKFSDDEIVHMASVKAIVDSLAKKG